MSRKKGQERRGKREGRKKLDLPLIHLELQGVSLFFFTNLNRAPSPQAWISMGMVAMREKGGKKKEVVMVVAIKRYKEGEGVGTNWVGGCNSSKNSQNDLIPTWCIGEC